MIYLILILGCLIGMIISKQAEKIIVGAVNKSTLQMLSSPIFYVMLAMLFVGSTLGLMAISEAATL